VHRSERSGSYVPEWLLERRRRAGRALVSVVATSYGDWCWGLIMVCAVSAWSSSPS